MSNQDGLVLVCVLWGKQYETHKVRERLKFGVRASSGQNTDTQELENLLGDVWIAGHTV